jgi:HNH endonuclease
MLKRKRFTPTERNFIMLRAKGCCEYCQTLYDFSPDTFEIEHIKSLFEGGTNELDNLAFSCGGCNSNKYYRINAIDPSTNEIVPLFNPRLDIWAQHFQWQENFSIIEAITPKGRVTVDLLKLNRIGLVNLRKALVNYGVFPPSDL